MRNDARQLLEKLSRQDFRYKQFEDPYSDIKLWPIFEALLQDNRVVGQEPEVSVSEDLSVKRKAPLAPFEVNAPHASNFLSQYAQGSPQPSGEENAGEDTDLRGFLNNLAGSVK